MLKLNTQFIANMDLTFQKGLPQYSEDFGNLVSMSAAELIPAFGTSGVEVLKSLFCHKSNLFSYEHTQFVSIDSKNIGMILSYDWKTEIKQSIKTGLLLVKYMKFQMLSGFPLLMGVNRVSGGADVNDYYISNVAVRPDYRGSGIGKALMLLAEDHAIGVQAMRIVLDVEVNNKKAIAFYNQLGYVRVGQVKEIITCGETHGFCRLTKPVSNTL